MFSPKRRKKLDSAIKRKILNRRNLPTVWNSVKSPSNVPWTVQMRKDAAASLEALHTKTTGHRDEKRLARIQFPQAKTKLNLSPSLIRVIQADKMKRLQEFQKLRVTDPYSFIWAANDFLKTLPADAAGRKELKKAVSACIQNQSIPNLDSLLRAIRLVENK